MKNATTNLFLSALLLAGLSSMEAARTLAVPTTMVATRGAVADAQMLAQTHNGARVMAISGNSMIPFFGEGAVIVVKPIGISQIRVGMLLVYRNRFGETIAHRAIARLDSGWQVKGYNNPAADSTLVTSENLIGVIYATFHPVASPAEETGLLAAGAMPVEIALAAPAK